MRRTDSLVPAWLLAGCALLLVAGAARGQGDLADQLAQALTGVVDHEAALPVVLPVTVRATRRAKEGVRLRFGRHSMIYIVHGKSGEAEREEFVIGSRRYPVQPTTPAMAPMDVHSITATLLRIDSRKYIALQASGTGLMRSGRAQRYVFVHLFAQHRTAVGLDAPVSFANLYLGARSIGRLPDGGLGVALIEATDEAGQARFTATPMAVKTAARSLVAAGERREIGQLRQDGVFARSK